jgi:hypothetical protein
VIAVLGVFRSRGELKLTETVTLDAGLTGRSAPVANRAGPPGRDQRPGRWSAGGSPSSLETGPSPDGA